MACPLPCSSSPGQGLSDGTWSDSSLSDRTRSGCTPPPPTPPCLLHCWQTDRHLWKHCLLTWSVNISRRFNTKTLAITSGTRPVDGGGAPTSKVGAPTYYLAKFLPKTAWKWLNLGREGGALPWRHPLDPPMPTVQADTIKFFYKSFSSSKFWQNSGSIDIQFLVTMVMLMRINLHYFNVIENITKGRDVFFTV